MRPTWRMREFRTLFVWQKAHRLALDVNVAMETANSRRYTGLRSQIVRAAASIPANIAEGCGKSTSREFARYVEIAIGSAMELDNHLLLARDSAVIERQTYDDLAPRIAEVRRMSFSFLRAVRSRSD